MITHLMKDDCAHLDKFRGRKSRVLEGYYSESGTRITRQNRRLFRRQFVGKGKASYHRTPAVNDYIRKEMLHTRLEAAKGRRGGARGRGRGDT